MSHDGTGRYVPVRTGTSKCPKVRTRTYLTAYKAVQGSTERYRAVQNGTGQYTKWYKAVHGGTCQYTVCICAGPRAGPGAWGAADFGALLKSLHSLHQQWLQLQVIACTNSFIHPLVLLPAPPLPRALRLPPAAAAAGNAAAGAWPAAAAAATGGVHIPIPPAPPSAGGGAAGGTSACGGEAVFEVTVLVVMNGIGRRRGV